MVNEAKVKPPIAETIAAGIVLIAAFMRWASIVGMPDNIPLVEPIALSITGWSGYVTVAGMQFQNWLVIVAAAVAVLGSWLGAYRVWELARACSLVSIAYGLFHTGLAWFIFTRHGQVDAGLVVTIAAFVVLLILTLRTRA